MEIRDVQKFRTTPEVVQAYPSNIANLLRPPTLVEPDPRFSIIVTEIKVSTRGDGDVFWIEDAEGYGLRKDVLLAFAEAGGLRFSIAQMEYDDHESPVASLAVTRLIAPQTWTQMPGAYALNIGGREEAAVLEIDAEDDPVTKVALEGELAKLLAGLRKFGVQIAETGAMLRATRAMLGVAQTYSKAKIRKVFAVPRLHWLAVSDEALRLATEITSGDIFGEGAKHSDQEQVLARALMEALNPGAPAVVSAGRVGLTYYQRKQEWKNKVLDAGTTKGLSEKETRQQVRDWMGTTIDRLTVAQLKSVWARMTQGGQA